MPEQTLIEDPTAIGALQGLLDLTKTADEAPLHRVLEVAGEAIAMSTGFRLVYMNVYRPEYDDYAAMLVHGRPELSDASAPPIPRDFLARLPGTPVQRAPGIYFVAGTRGMWDGHPNFIPSRTPEADGPDAWHSEDLLLMLIEDVDGEPLGLLSVDEPVSGCGRPTTSCNCCARSASTSSRRCAPLSALDRMRRTRACSRGCRRSRRSCPSVLTGASCIGWSATRSPPTSGSSGSRSTSPPGTRVCGGSTSRLGIT